MKSRTFLLAALMSAPITASGFAAESEFGSLSYSDPSQASAYFTGDSIVTLAMLALAAGGAMLFKFAKQQRRLAAFAQVSQANVVSDDKWRGAVYRSLEVELQEFSSHLSENSWSRA